MEWPYKRLVNRICSFEKIEQSLMEECQPFAVIEPRREKTGLRGFGPGPTQTGQYSHRNRLEARYFGYINLRNCTNRVVKTKDTDLLCSYCTADLCLCFHNGQICFYHGAVHFILITVDTEIFART